MSELSRRISRIEQVAGHIAPGICIRCAGRTRLVFPDEPTNVGGYPYIDGRCPTCGNAPVTKMIELFEQTKKVFATIPWSSDPERRYREKLNMIFAIWRASAERRGDMQQLKIFSRMKERESIDRQLDRLYAQNGGQ